MAVFNVAESFNRVSLICVPENGNDPETGCRACGEGARSVYEQCRQTYYLKQQVSATKKLSEEKNISPVSISEIDSLRSENVNLKSEILKQEQVLSEINYKNSQNYNITDLQLASIIIFSLIVGYIISFLINKLISNKV
jgi:CRISPR/Cas system-associated protein Cas5 (RAMP superfamily)